MAPFCQLVHHEMSDVSDPVHICDADVAGPGATSNVDLMDVDIDIPSEPAARRVHRISRSSKHASNSPAITLSHLFSNLEYANKRMLSELAKSFMTFYFLLLPSKVWQTCYVLSFFLISLMVNVQI